MSNTTISRDLITALHPLYEQLGITTATEKMKLTRGVFQYLRSDREHFIVMDEDPDSFGTPNCRNGFVCQLVPVAQVFSDVEDDFEREVTATVISLISPPKESRYQLVYSTERFVYNKSSRTSHFCFPAYREFDPSVLCEYMTAELPETIRPVSTERDWDIYCMVFRAYAHMAKNLHPSNVPFNTERAMFALRYTDETTQLIDDRTVTGKLLPMTINCQTDTVFNEDRKLSVTEQLMLLITKEELSYVLHTETKRTPLKNDPLDIFPLDDDAAETTSVYRRVRLEDVTSYMFTKYF